MANTPEPPYTTVVFSSVRADAGEQAARAYDRMSERMFALAAEQPGYLGVETAHTPGGLGITVSYWADDAAAAAWKRVTEHVVAQERGVREWYADYRVRVATVTRAYGSA